MLAQGRDGLGDVAYERHQPEQILRYHLVEAHYRFPFTLRYLFAAHPETMGKVLGIGYRAISTHLIYKAGLQIKDGATGAVALIQRVVSAIGDRTRLAT